MNIAVLLKNSARSFPDRPAISFGKTLYATYGQFADRVARLAATFRAAGLAQGDRVGIAMGNAPEYLEIMFGIWPVHGVAPAWTLPTPWNRPRMSNSLSSRISATTSSESGAPRR